VLIFLGLIINLAGVFWLGIALYGAAVLFTVVTLPVEFDASRRALVQLQGTAGLPPEQVAGARAVLNAAALTYVAAALIAALQLLYLIGLARDN
jgi:Zn-dependent membrane protease YugP